MTPRVFVTQRKLTPDRYRGPGLHARINEAKFARFGVPVYLMPDTDLFEVDPEVLAVFPARIERALNNADYRPGKDYLLICGDTGIGAMTYHAMLRRGAVKLLVWDKVHTDYIEAAVSEEFSDV